VAAPAHRDRSRLALDARRSAQVGAAQAPDGDDLGTLRRPQGQCTCHPAHLRMELVQRRPGGVRTGRRLFHRREGLCARGVKPAGVLGARTDAGGRGWCGGDGQSGQ
jgi:hypothetical protein